MTWLFFFFPRKLYFNSFVRGLCVVQFSYFVIILMINKSDSSRVVVRFCSHSYYCRPHWTHSVLLPLLIVISSARNWRSSSTSYMTTVTFTERPIFSKIKPGSPRQKQRTPGQNELIMSNTRIALATLGGSVAQWLGRLPWDPEIPGSRPALTTCWICSW